MRPSLKLGPVTLGPWSLGGLGMLLLALLGLLAYVYLRPPPVPRFVLDGHSFIQVSPKTRNGTLVVVYSGDGGWWGDLDRKIAEWFAHQGYAVVGADTNIYFHDPLSEERVAADLNNLILDLSYRWHAPRVALIGYSFGADVMPLAYNRLSKAAQKKVVFMGLLALGKTSPLQVTLSEQTGVDTEGPATEPELAKVPVKKILCIYGKDEEKDTGCRLAVLAKADILPMAGSHHFDHQYERLEAELQRGIARRSKGFWPFQDLGWTTKTSK